MSPHSPPVVIAPADELADEFAGQMERVAGEAVRQRGQFSLAIPGGSVARAFLPRLGGAELPWRSTTLFQVDERAVPPDSPESNAALALEMLRDTPALRLARWRPIRVGEDLDAAARGYARKLAEMLGTPPVLDVVLLGVGEDGHVASLFPGHDPVGAWVAPVHDAPKPPAARISLTYAMLLAANRVYIAALGSGKASIIQALVRGDAHETPAGRVLAGARDPRLFLDPAAAAGIRDVNT